MGKKLAIKGHSTRGKEVIELLKMMGGTNVHNLSGNNSYAYYTNDINQNTIRGNEYMFDEDMQFFTLEDFLKKYPFKVGDKVVYTKFGDNCDEYPVTIESIKWTGTTIEYTFNDCVTCLAKDLKMWNGESEEPDRAKAPKLKGEDYSDKRFGYKIPDGYEFDVVVDGKIFLKSIKSKYPKTYYECCDILNIETNRIIDYDDCLGYRDITQYDTKLLTQLRCLRKIRICRDAYWKIAGEQMGLGKPWEPDWSNDDETKFCIYTTQNIISLDIFGVDNRILAFPTEEMRDAFFENFKDLIEACKELL